MADDRYELYYWPGIQGRGEFVRLALEAAGQDYVDVARLPEEAGGGIPALQKILASSDGFVPYAPPILKVGDVTVSHTAAILDFVGPRLDLVVPGLERVAHQYQLTLTDFIAEIHDVHHPISSALYYEDQKAEARRAAESFHSVRAPKYLGYFERALSRAETSGSRHLVGNALGYVDLSLFQVMTGLRYMFPRAMAKSAESYPLLSALTDRVAAEPKIAAYLASPRRIAFNEHGLFRAYPDIDT